MAALLVLVILLPLLAALTFLCLTRRRGRASSARLPPSPWELPLIGHLHHFVGSPPHRAIRDLASRHGPLMLLRLGGLPVVIASSADAAREVMQTHDLDFAARPVTPMLRLNNPKGAEGIFFAPYGDEWRLARKICIVELLSARRVQSLRLIREEEASHLLSAVASAPPAQAVNLSKLLLVYATDSSVRAVLGCKFRDRDTFFRMLEDSLRMFARLRLPDLYPSSRLAMLVSRMPGRIRRHEREAYNLITAIIRERELQDSGRSHGDGSENFLDTFLRIHREGDLQVPISTDNIKAVCGDMFATGSETVATMLQWTMAELMKNPRVMHKAQDEVRQVLAGRHKVTEDDLSSLHYMHLVIKEVLRLHRPAPPLVPRECQKDCQVLGFDVPKGTMVFLNAWAINRDPEYWDMPEQFMPERFEDGKIDFKGTDFEYTPFGAGRRMCPGMTFAMAHIKLALASLLYHFDWKLPYGMEAADLDMTEDIWTFTGRRLQDLLLVPVVRVPLQVDKH